MRSMSRHSWVAAKKIFEDEASTERAARKRKHDLQKQRDIDDKAGKEDDTE